MCLTYKVNINCTLFSNSILLVCIARTSWKRTPNMEVQPHHGDLFYKPVSECSWCGHGSINSDHNTFSLSLSLSRKQDQLLKTLSC